MIRKLAVSACALLIVATSSYAGETQNLNKDSKVEKTLEQLQTDFVKLKFGMFIHFNMATYQGQEWVAGYPDASDFNPGAKIDTDASPMVSQRYGIRSIPYFARFEHGKIVKDVVGAVGRAGLQALAG